MHEKLQGEVDSTSNATSRRDPDFLFRCHVEWHQHGNIRAYETLVAALDDASEQIRHLAESFLHRPSPRPESSKAVFPQSPERR